MPQDAAQAQVTTVAEGLEYATCTHVGLKRAINQDSFDSRLAAAEEDAAHGHLFVVADGMGAHAAGELASRLAADEVREATGTENHADVLRHHFQKANTTIHERGQANPQLYNMGTTCSALWILPQGALVGHVGDSRVYRCRANRIEQLTFDHSLVWEMRAAGQYSGDHASNVPRNVITRCLGPHPHVEVDLEGPFSIRSQDAFLLCSDGLTGRIEDAELGVALRYLSAKEAAEFLVDLANLRGGHDNITATIVKIPNESLAVESTTESQQLHSQGTRPLWWLLAGAGMFSLLLAVGLKSNPGAICGAALLLIGALGGLFEWRKHRQTRASASAMPSPPYSVAPAELSDRIAQQFLETLREHADGAAHAQIDELSHPAEDGAEAFLKTVRQLARQLR